MLKRLISLINKIINTLKKNPAKLKYFLKGYLTGCRSILLDISTFHSFHVQQDVISFFLYPPEKIIHTIKTSTDPEAVNALFEKLLHKRARIHRRHFISLDFNRKFISFLKSHSSPREILLRLKCEDDRQDFDFVWGKFLFLTDSTYTTHPLKISKNRISGEVQVRLPEEMGKLIAGNNTSDKFTFTDPACFNSSFETQERSVPLPPVNCYEYKNAVVTPGMIILKENNFIAYEPAANPTQHVFIAGNYHFITGMPKGSTAITDIPYSKSISVPAASLIFGRCFANYFHWTIEYLPKIKTLLAAGTPPPILLPRTIPRQQLELVQILLKEFNLEYIEVDADTLVHAETLWVPSALTYHPDDLDIPFWKGGALHNEHIQFLRSVLSKKFKDSKVPSKGSRIALARKNVAARNIENSAELYDLWSENGFTIVYPEDHTLEEQIAIIGQADVIVAPCGATLTNILFMKPGALVISMLADHNKSYCMYSNLAKLCGIKYMHLTGTPTRTRYECNDELEFMHTNFSIDLNDVKKVLSNINTTKNN